MLTTLLTVKARIGLAPDDIKDDVLLGNFIGWASARFDNECNRVFAAGNYEDEFQGDETELRLRAYPVSAITAIALKSNETDGFQAQTNVDYVIRRAMLISLRATVGRSSDVLKVSYTGGYVMPVDPPDTQKFATLTPLPADVQQAATEQVAYWWQNKSRLGIVSMSGEGGSIGQFAKLDLLPTVAATLKKYERWMP